MNTIHTLHTIDKPREKLLRYGGSILKDYELLSVILGSGIPKKDVLKLSQEIIQLFQTHFSVLTTEHLVTIHGLGPAKASKIIAAIELSKRYLHQDNKQIVCAKDIYNKLHSYQSKKQEHFITITLDGANKIITQRVVFIGTLNESLVHPREVFADALQDRAASIILAHNHPSGTLYPSQEDIQITQRLLKSASLLGIDLLDHIIITRNGYLSMKEENFF